MVEKLTDWVNVYIYTVLSNVHSIRLNFSSRLYWPIYSCKHFDGLLISSHGCHQRVYSHLPHKAYSLMWLLQMEQRNPFAFTWYIQWKWCWTTTFCPARYVARFLLSHLFPSAMVHFFPKGPVLKEWLSQFGMIYWIICIISAALHLALACVIYFSLSMWCSATFDLSDTFYTSLNPYRVYNSLQHFSSL